MKNYTFQNTLVSKKQLKQILSWTFTNYGSVQASFLADELKYLGFKYSTKAGISISIEDLKIPPIKNSMLEKSNNEIIKTESVCLNGEITEVERFQKVIDTWNITSETLKDEVVSYFRNYDPLNSVYMMAFSGARGNLSQVRQLVGMRGLMSDPNGEIMDLPIKQNFREGLTITDYLMSGYGARKGIVDTALKTANSGYLTRRLIDVAQDIIIREKDCLTNRSIQFIDIEKNSTIIRSLYDRILGRILSNDIYVPNSQNEILIKKETQITPTLIQLLKKHKIKSILIRSPLTCGLNRSICQKCYGWNLANENLVDLGEAVGIIAGQSIGEPGTQLTMRTFHTGGIFTAGSNQQIISSVDGTVEFSEFLKTNPFRTPQGENVLQTENSGSLRIELLNDEVLKIEIPANTLLFVKNRTKIEKGTVLGQIVETNKQTKNETKEVLSKLSGEVYLTQPNKDGSKLAWILSGKLFNISNSAYLNFKDTRKIFKHSAISRLKIVNKHSGFIKIVKDSINLDRINLQILSNSTKLETSVLQKLKNYQKTLNYSLKINDSNFLLNNFEPNSSNLISLDTSQVFGTRLTNKYDTVTGGIPYFLNNNASNTMLWLSEETHTINRDSSVLKVENFEFITEKQEIASDIFSKVPGIVEIIEKNNIVQEIIIRPGFLYKIKDYQNYDQKIFYPGEILFNDFEVNQISISEIVITRSGPEILIRPISIYQIPKQAPRLSNCTFKIEDLFVLKNKINSNISSIEKIKSHEPLKLFEEVLIFDEIKDIETLQKNEIDILARINNNKNLEFLISEKISLNDFIPKDLAKSKIHINLIAQNGQFINSFSTLGYIETIASESLDIIKIKTRVEKNKRLLCIREKDCTIVPKSKFSSYKIDDFINNVPALNLRGKIISELKDEIIIQNGRPYFFPKNAKIFCQNGDLIEKDQNIGELSFEKEITGDIVQGLPRVEEILEARKVKKEKENSLIKKSIICKNSFKFIKLGNSRTGSENINLHSLLDLFFVHYLEFESLYEATYRSIKKVQGLILNLIQSVYQSQGVVISDKHLEVIIKQMTTKVKVTHEGDTPLLPNELVDLKQIQYINESIQLDKKETAFYQPILLGITRASLNTESFISAASFQETTRVLTKAAVEGKIDWLRGLKENVIIGRLIPAGTGFNSYSDLSSNNTKLISK